MAVGCERGRLMNEISGRQLLSTARAGDVLDGGRKGDLRRVSGSHIRRLCQSHTDDIDPHGIRLKNVLVTGELDLAGLRVPFPISFVSCEFTEPPVVEGAELHALAFRGCQRLPGLLGNGVRVRRDLDLSHSRISGQHETSASTSGAAVWLCESGIGGRFLCVGTVLETAEESALVGFDVERVDVRAAVGECGGALGAIQLAAAVALGRPGTGVLITGIDDSGAVAAAVLTIKERP